MSDTPTIHLRINGGDFFTAVCEELGDDPKHRTYGFQADAVLGHAIRHAAKTLGVTELQVYVDLSGIPNFGATTDGG